MHEFIGIEHATNYNGRVIAKAEVHTYCVNFFNEVLLYLQMDLTHRLPANGHLLTFNVSTPCN